LATFWILSGIEFTTHFIEFAPTETNQLVGSNPNVIYMRETFGERSSMAARSKHQALAFCFSVQMCYMF